MMTVKQFSFLLEVTIVRTREVLYCWKVQGLNTNAGYSKKPDLKEQREGNGSITNLQCLQTIPKYMYFLLVLFSHLV